MHCRETRMKRKKVVIRVEKIIDLMKIYKAEHGCEEVGKQAQFLFCSREMPI